MQVAVGGPSNTQNNGSSQVEVKAPEPASSGQTFVNNDQSTDVQNTTAVTDGAPVISKAPPVAPTNDSQTQSPPTGNSDIAIGLRDAAKQHGEELVALGGGGNSTSTASGSSKSSPAGTKAYVAVEGDSLSKMAGRFLGSNTKANRDAIIAANPTLKQNPNIIVSGRTYNIPTSAAPSGGVTSVAPSPAPAPTPVAQAPAPTPVTPTTDNWYTVKDGDSLWKIATEQCGSAATIQAIKDLNKDTLKGDTVVINTKLRLPNKVASAN